MTSDESPVERDSTATTPPEDEGARVDASAPNSDSTASQKPARTRRSQTRKTEAPASATDPSASSETAPTRRSRRPRADSAGAEAVSSDVAPAPESAEPEAPKPRPRRTRKKAVEPSQEAPEASAAAAVSEQAADVSADPQPLATAREPLAIAEPEAPARRTRPASRRRRSAPAEAAVEAPPVAGQEAAPAEAPAAEAEVAAPSPARPSRRRRRSTPSSSPAEGAAAQQTDQGAAAETPPSEQEGEQPAGRGGRRSRRRPEAGAEAGAETEAGVTAPAAPSRPRRSASRRRAAEAEAPSPGARIAVRRGHPEIVVNGVTVPPFLFFGNLSGQKELRRVSSEVERAAKAGIHVHSTLIELVCPIPPDDTVYEATDTRLQTILDADPQALLIPRIVFVPAPGWRAQYPNEVNHYADGSTDDPSIASHLFWADAVHALRALVEHILRTTYGERVIGFHLERGEWFHPADLGYDRSYANREGFRRWLRTKYHNSEVALRAAWYDGAVQFYTVDIPPPPPTDRPEDAFFEPRKERRWIDFNEYTSEAIAERLIELSRAVKEVTGDRALVSVCYGYTYEFGHPHSGHLALARLLAAPSIDLVCGPPSYRERPAGSSGAFPGPVDSPAIHGKLWVSEDDTKTHLSTGHADGDDFNPRMENRTATEQVHLRALGSALAHQTGIGFMDLWGEGWLDAEDIWQRIAPFVERQAAYARHRKGPSPDVVVLVDERSIAHVRRGDKFLRRILQGQRDAFLRCGASVAFCLQSDLTARAFPTDARLYVFLTPYRLTVEQRSAIREKLQNGGKTLVWVYAVGVCAERGEPEDSPIDLVGMSLRRQPWHSEVGSRFVESRHPITERMQERTLGIRERLNPSFYVDDDAPGIVRLAEYQQTGFTSVAVREMQDWRSVFCGEPAVSAELARGLCRYAGVHLYTSDVADYVYAGPGWLVHHSTRDGVRTVAPPPGLSLYDVVEDHLVDDGAGAFRAPVRARTTRCFFVGTIEEMRRMGFTNLEPAPRRPVANDAPMLPPPPPLPTFPDQPPAHAPAAAPPEGGLQSAGEAPEGALPEGEPVEQANLPGAPTEEKGDVPKTRRRRRRGGRGRGKRRSKTPETPEAPKAEE